MEILMFILIITVYLLPAIIASCRKHKNMNSILALNILLGWCGLGWIGAFVWSLTTQEK